MIRAGTKDLAEACASVASHLGGGSTDEAIHVLDASGRPIAAGGHAAADAGLECAIFGDQLEVVGLDSGRVAHCERIVMPDEDVVWIVLTVAAGHGRGLAEFAAAIRALFEREAMRELEAEDTTEHLLSCFEQIRAVHDLADQLPACESIEEMGRLCLESLLLALGVRLGAIVLRREGADRCPGLFVSESGSSFWSDDVHVSQGSPLAAAFGDGKVRYGDISTFEIPPDAVEAEALDWLMIVPICFGSEDDETVLGCLVLMDRDESDESKGKAFGNPEAELTQSVSVLLGLALGTRTQAAAEKELQIARQIQATLIPERPPSWPGLDLAGRNRSANQVGGDYFDYLEAASGGRYVVIADVSGHNMASAMAMVMARSQLRSIMSHRTSPADIYGELTRGMYQDLVRNELFITSFLLKLVERDGDVLRVRYTNAGHNQPLLLRAGGEVEWLDGGGPMVGFMPSVDYEEEDLTLAAGDIIILYTDGVTEATNPAGEMLDESGLADIVGGLRNAPAAEILDRIYEAVEEHTASQIDEDDITAVVIKVLPLANEDEAVKGGSGS